MAHKFDPQTHRCACGRYERGYKPKVEPVRPRGECQICEECFALVGGRLGHHGYQRPGVGFIIGDCMGVAHAPFPATDALEAYKAVCERVAAEADKRIAELQAATEVTYRYTVRVGREKTPKSVTLRKGEYAGWNAECGQPFPTFDAERRRQEWEQQDRRDQANREADRAGSRIAKAKAITAQAAGV